MLPLRYSRRWKIASLVILLLVLAGALMPAIWFWDDKFKALSLFRGVDKWVHGVTFLALSVWFCGLYQRSAYWRIGVGLLAFGLMIEAFQRLLSYRTAEWFDVAADGVGIMAGLAIGIAGIGGWCLRAEEHFAKRRRG